VEKGNKKILKKLWVWVREVQVNLKDDMLLAKGVRGRTAWTYLLRRASMRF
jgi:hypothetical protein